VNICDELTKKNEELTQHHFIHNLLLIKQLEKPKVFFEEAGKT
jgi:hypothetical protein